jgi:hypothetical protein
MIVSIRMLALSRRHFTVGRAQVFIRYPSSYFVSNHDLRALQALGIQTLALVRPGTPPRHFDSFAIRQRSRTGERDISSTKVRHPAQQPRLPKVTFLEQDTVSLAGGKGEGARI